VSKNNFPRFFSLQYIHNKNMSGLLSTSPKVESHLDDLFKNSVRISFLHTEFDRLYTDRYL
jgi:hypothetical protein